jgi:23S rRNA (adenine2503-C2)-methyltransferase
LKNVIFLIPGKFFYLIRLKRNILSLLQEELKEFMVANYGEAPYRATQVFQWLYKPISGFEGMTNIPKSLLEKLASDFELGIPEIAQQHTSTDGTIKFLMKLADNNIIECVLIPYHHGDSVCISTQVGCKLGCAFCASGRNGFIRNLEPGEIIGQILAMQRVTGRRITNVSLMGTGEPLDNFANIKKFLEIIHDPKGENLSYRNISLSTAGIAPKIRELGDLKLPITLCISLHFPTDEQRQTFMPINRSYNIQEILSAVKYYIEQTNSRVSFEYTMIRDVNDSVDHAKILAKLVKGLLCHINLIPINHTEDQLKTPDRNTVEIFKQYLERKKIPVSIRRKAGDDIAAACGQLRRWYLNEDQIQAPENEKKC